MKKPVFRATVYGEEKLYTIEKIHFDRKGVITMITVYSHLDSYTGLDEDESIPLFNYLRDSVTGEPKILEEGFLTDRLGSITGKIEFVE